MENKLCDCKGVMGTHGMCNGSGGELCALPDGSNLDITRIWAAIEALRCNEGDAVTLLSDNADFGGHNNAIFVCGDWTNWKEQRFTGESILAALESAVVARNMV